MLRHRFGRSTICIHGASAYSSALEFDKTIGGWSFWVENVHQMSFASTQMECYSALAETKCQEFEPNKDKK